MKLDRYLSLADFERAARQRLPRTVYGFVSGGTEDERTLHANSAAFEQLGFVARGLRNVSQRTTSTELWGEKFAAPIGIAPMGIAAMCRYECDLALAHGAHDAQVPFILSGSSNVPLETIQQQAPGFWYQGYFAGDTERIARIIARLKAAQVQVLVVTIDTCVGANRENNARQGFTIPFSMNGKLLLDGMLHPRWSFDVFARTLLKSGVPRWCNLYEEVGCPITEDPPGGFRTGRDLLDWDHLSWLRDQWPGRLVVKGVMHPGDASEAVKRGLDAVIVSNHGGRQLDSAISTLQALPDVVAAVPPGFPVLIDGGFRRGTDVLKAIALGARMVFVGRPFMYAAAIGGRAGVQHAITILQTEITRNLALLGCNALGELTPQDLRVLGVMDLEPMRSTCDSSGARESQLSEPVSVD